MAPAGFLKCAQSFSIFFLCFVISHRKLFYIVSGHLMFKIRLKHLFTEL
jgi:hypothetical protein